MHYCKLERTRTRSLNGRNSEERGVHHSPKLLPYASGLTLTSVRALFPFAVRVVFYAILSLSSSLSLDIRQKASVDLELFVLAIFSTQLTVPAPVLFVCSAPNITSRESHAICR